MIFLVRLIIPLINVQLLFYGLNLALGFLSFYFLLGLWINNNRHNFYIKIAGSIFYIFSIFSFYTVWSKQLFAMYLVSVFPFVLYLFIKAILKRKIFYLVLAATIISLFSILLLSVPWLVALILASLPLIFYIFLQNKKVFFKFFIIFLFLLILLNFFWLSHFIYSSFSSDKAVGDAASTATSTEFRKANETTILAVSRNNELLYPLFNLFHKQIQVDYHWLNFNIYKEWNLKFLPLNLIFLLIIILGAFYAKRVSKKDRGLYIVSFVSWLVILFLFTVNIGSWGTPLFLWLNNHVPGFVMFRNMFDKFGLALAFSCAFLLVASLKICFDNFKKDWLKNIILVAILLSTILNAKPFILGEYYENSIWTTKDTHNTISDFNDDFYHLLDYLKNNHEASRYLWLPMNIASYIQIQDKNLDNHYYSGVSPLRFLADTSDFSGFMSFGDFQNTLVENLVDKKDFSLVVKLMQKMNVKYIIINNDISKDLQDSYLYSRYKKSDIYNIQQDENFLKTILGKKIKDFGFRYSLYSINDNYKNEKIYLTDDFNKIPVEFDDLEYKKYASYKYEIVVRGLKEKKNLVFLDPYHKLWRLYLKNGNKLFTNGSHEVVFDYANGWTIDPEYIKQNFPKEYYEENPDGSINIELALYFKPQSYFYLGLVISGVTFLGCLGYLCYDCRRRKRIGISVSKDDETKI
jgi:hypothetical protein